MKAILMSIHPKYCDLIAEGKKTIEVRKTRPKINVPFKCYIYCTKPYTGSTEDRFYIYLPPHDTPKQVNGTVIGEFICDDIDTIAVFNDILYCINNTQANKLKQMCLTIEEIKAYLGSKNEGFNWHISNLVIYDRPRWLSDFKTIKCINKKSSCGECKTKPNCIKPITRPPQSWCYVEEVNNE